MARLMASIDDNRNPYKVRGRWVNNQWYNTAPQKTNSRTHRLADSWSEVAVQTWDIKVSVRMEDTGQFLVTIEDLETKKTAILTCDNPEEYLGRKFPKRQVRSGKVVKPRPRKKRLTAAEKRELARVDQLFGMGA